MPEPSDPSPPSGPSEPLVPSSGLRHLGEFSGLAGLAVRQRGVFPDAVPGPALRRAAREAVGVLDLVAEDVRVERAWEAGDISGEELSWSVGYGPRTRAYLLRPRGVTGVLPGVVALHCHAGMKWAGKDKIADGPEPPSPEVLRLRRDIYGGRAYAGELARRGFAVLAHDVLGWGSRRFPLDAMPEPIAALARAESPREHPPERPRENPRENPREHSREDPPEQPPEHLSEADRYDRAAAQHEHLLEKYCTLLGTSLAGVVAGEDLAAAAYLRHRPNVGPVGCVGLSGGGLRAALLGAFDPGVRAVAIAAMVSSYRDMLDCHVTRHTWMLYPPGLSRLCDYPTLVAARAPDPLLVLYAERDELSPAAGRRRAHETIARHYPDGGYEGAFHDAPHAFDLPMQEHAFAWLADRLSR
ncbi:acetylesterase [Nonomuraea indica]|uniref:acetylesterase n=1 Tax=Nonomuraea indica TaxID=1581193 RepID=UPI000C7B239E|nr:acetylesterase [Nonomuraea indica]